MDGVCSSDVKGDGREAALPALNWKLARLVGARREATLQKEWADFGGHGKAE